MSKYYKRGNWLVNLLTFFKNIWNRKNTRKLLYNLDVYTSPEHELGTPVSEDDTIKWFNTEAKAIAAKQLRPYVYRIKVPAKSIRILAGTKWIVFYALNSKGTEGVYKK